MKHLKLTAEEKTGNTPAIPNQDKPEYPYGLRVHLDENTLTKLGVDKLPSVGEKGHMHTKYHVAAVSAHDSGDGKQRSVELQITHMEMAHGADHEETDGETKGKKLYGGEQEK